MLYLLDKAMIG